MLDLFFAAVISAADPTVVAQAQLATPPATTQSSADGNTSPQGTQPSTNYSGVYSYCQDVENLRPNSANNDYWPFTGDLIKKWGGKGGLVYTPDRIAELGLKVSILEAPKHGKVILTDPPGPAKGMVPAGSTSFHYEFQPDKNYLGKDRVVYEIEAQGKKYKVTINFWVVPVVAPEPLKGDTPRCLKQNFDGSALDPTLLNGPSGYVITGYSCASLPLGGESAIGASMHRGPRLDPIGESAIGASMHRGSLSTKETSPCS